MAQFVVCDRCKQPISEADDSAADLIKREYPDIDLCQECYLQISLEVEVVRRAAITQTSPKEILQKWLDNYK